MERSRFDSNGNLPPGVVSMTLDEVKEAFTWTPRRQALFRGLAAAARNLSAAGVPAIWIDGSFTTSKNDPGDVDGCWEYIPSVKVDLLDPVFLDLHPPRVSMKAKYGVDFLIAGVRLSDAGGATVQEFFQVDRDGHAKGIVRIDLGVGGRTEGRGSRRRKGGQP
jgi:hypothetical protein